MERQIMISVNPPYSTMIEEEYKKIEFRKRVLHGLRKGTTIWFYETKNKGGRGRIIGSGTLVAVIPLDALYEPYGSCECFMNHHVQFWNYCFDRNMEVPYAPDFEYVRKVRNNMQEEYLKYSFANNKDYLSKIGIGGRYAILFDDFKEECLQLKNFISTNTLNTILHPPQSMMNVFKK